ncbi:MAG: DUF2157 domain-containing protein [Haliscomenobacter sp.]|nr:DUF2157 domain-containing protein [Haliscomenobacter sp.]
MSKREIRWLFQQLPEWVEEGFVSEAQAGALRRRYAPDTQDSTGLQLGVIAIGIVGALLIGGGVVSIIAYNWEYLSRDWQTAISFLPVILGLVLYGYVFFKKRNSLVWKESGSAVLMLFLGATISLISETYHLTGTADAFLKPWLLLSIPLLYLLNSSLSAIIYLIGATAWALQVSRPETVGFWGFLVMAIPHLAYNFYRAGEWIRKHLLAWAFMISWAFGWFASTVSGLSEYIMVGTGLWLSVFCLLSAVLFPSGRIMVRQPFLLFGLAGMFIMGIICAYGTKVPGFHLGGLWGDMEYPFWAAMTNFAVLVILALAWIVLGWIHWKSIGFSLESALLFGFPLVLALYVAFTDGQEKDLLAIILANLYGLAIGVAYLREGIRSNNLLDLNIGMLFILALALTRFFDAEWSLIVKGVAFILLGIAFLLANLYIAKRRVNNA